MHTFNAVLGMLELDVGIRWLASLAYLLNSRILTNGDLPPHISASIHTYKHTYTERDGQSRRQITHTHRHNYIEAHKIKS